MKQSYPLTTQADIEVLRAAGLDKLADIGQRYVDAGNRRRNRWYRRLLRLFVGDTTEPHT